MVVRLKAKKDSVSECKGREILAPETSKKSFVNNKTMTSTPHVDLTFGVPTETGREQSPVYRSGNKFLFLG